MLMILALWIQHTSLARISQCHLGARLVLCAFDTSVPTPRFWYDRCPWVWQSRLFFAFLCFQKNLLCVLYFSQLPSWQLFELLPLRACIQNFHCLGHKNKLVHNIAMTQWVEHPFSAMWSSWSFGGIPFKRFLVDSWASTMRACFDFWILLVPLDSLSLSRCLNGRSIVFSLQSIAASIGFFNVSFPFFVVSLNSLSCGSITIRLSTFSHCRASVSRWPIAAFPFVELLLTCHK